jgi:hypothetical protein
MYATKIYLFSLFLSGLLMASCKDEVSLPVQPLENYVKVYMPQAVDVPRAYSLKISDTAQEIIYSASCGGQDYPTSDIKVNFAVSNELVDSFNKANGTNYAVMPDKSYDLSTLSAVIAKGTLSTGPLKIFVKTNGPGAIPFLKDYLLPVSIRDATEKINTKLTTTFFKVRAQPQLSDYPAYNRTGWKIIAFSSQEANGEGPDNGRAEFVLDNQPATYWHTQWQGTSPGPPHFLVVDMGETKTLHGLSFLDRQSDNAGKPKEVVVQISNDNTTWITAANFTLANTKDLQPQFLPAFQDARYFKVIINESYNGSYTHLAELNAF